MFSRQHVKRTEYSFLYIIRVHHNANLVGLGSMEEEINRVRNTPPNTPFLVLSSPHTPGCLLPSHGKNARQAGLSLNKGTSLISDSSFYGCSRQVLSISRAQSYCFPFSFVFISIGSSTKDRNMESNSYHAGLFFSQVFAKSNTNIADTPHQYFWYFSFPG